MSSSVIGVLPVVGRAKERAGRKCGNIGRIGDAKRLPDLDGVLGFAETLQPTLQARLLGFEHGHVAIVCRP